MKKELDKSLLISARYLILLGLIFTLPLIYAVFTFLTIYPVAGLLKLFYNVLILGNTLLINSQTVIQIIPACVAGSAYLLLLILNLSVSIRLKQRVYSILSSFLILLSLNILRIFFLSILYQTNAPFFDFTHKLFWYALSTIFVVGIWFAEVKLFKIKQIPFYSDIKFLYKTSILNKKINKT